MSIHRDAPAENRRVPAEAGTAQVLEIYPGARTAIPVRTRLRGSEAGMATAEYADT
ncbi:hypothetical protein ACQCSU_08165 [Pseudarthrobacter sp. O4]|uniref:hypothetical protein n=1 Tax=Pseudarthrobacter sp. O4 TaxID=3418417 RepID=UPI003CE9E034